MPMNQKQTKREIDEKFRNVKHILTSTMRTKLILAIYDHPKNLDDLRQEINKPSASILHGLKELEIIQLVQKNNKEYQLTSNGYILATNMIKLIDNWYAINQNKTFWNLHNLDDIPDDLLKKIYLLKDVDHVTSTTSDLSNAFNKYIKLISHSKNLKIIMPIYSENHFDQIIKNLSSKSTKHLDLIISKEIFNTLKRRRRFRTGILRNEKVNVICVEQDLKIFLTYSDKFMALTLFFKDGHYDDSQIIIGKNKNAILWASELYRFYEDKGDGKK